MRVKSEVLAIKNKSSLIISVLTEAALAICLHRNNADSHQLRIEPPAFILHHK